MQGNNASNTKRLARNTLFMYFRMGFLMLINLYTSRVVLQQLGVEDYGIYNLVGSVVIMFTSLKSIFASSTQRFLSFEIGQGNNDKLQLIYNMSTVINALISLLFFFIVEAVGLWFLHNKINVEPDRLVAAHWVFQFSVISTIISIMATPLDACVIAHERMDFFAYLSLFEGLARLLICYLLSLFGFDKLIVYGFLMMVVSIISRFINQIFCMSTFSECHLKRCWDKRYFKEMTSFAGWAFLGNTSNILAQNGLNMVLNIFGGPLVNAARGISYQVNTALSQFIGNISIVVKPYAIKTYSGGNLRKANELAYLSSKLYFSVQMIIVIIVTFLANWLIQLWLGQIPKYTIVFLDLVLIQSLVRSLHMPIDFLFAGKGDIKYYQIIEGVVLILPIPFAYLLLEFGLPYYAAFIAVIVCEILHILFISLLASKVCCLDIFQYFHSVIIPCIACSCVYLAMFVANYIYVDSLFFSILNVIIAIILVFVIMYKYGVNKEEKEMLFSLLKRKK